MNLSDLSTDQREAHSSILTWLNRGTRTKPALTFAGFAGTGKTTVVSVLAHELPRPLAFCSFAGKAASVLGRKLREHDIETTPYPENNLDLGIEEPRRLCTTRPPERLPLCSGGTRCAGAQDASMPPRVGRPR